MVVHDWNQPQPEQLWVVVGTPERDWNFSSMRLIVMSSASVGVATTSGIATVAVFGESLVTVVSPWSW